MQIGETIELSNFLFRIGRRDISDKIVLFKHKNHLRNIHIDFGIYTTLTNSTAELGDIAALSGALRPESGLDDEARKVVAALLSSWSECPKCGDFLSASLGCVDESRYGFLMYCRRNHPDNVYIAEDINLFLNPPG